MENVPVNQISLKNQEYFKVWDITKFIMSIVVVSIHTNALYSLGNILNRIICQGLSRIAVPLFFMVSAYFLYYKKGNSFISVKNFILRILKLYIFYFILFFPYIFYIRIWKYKSNGWGYALWNFISGLLFSSSFPGSWYLNAMIIASLFCLLVNKGKTARIFVVILSVSGYIFSCITSNYQALLGSGGGKTIYEIYLTLFKEPFNSFWIALPYFCMMYYMVKTNKQSWPFYKKRKIGAFISLVLLIIEIVFAYKFFNNINTDCYIMLLLTAYMIFINLNEIHSLKINLNICASLRKLSTIIYIWQFEWIFIIRNILELFFDTVNSVVLFFLVLFALLVTGVAIIILSENKKWKWLNNAY